MLEPKLMTRRNSSILVSRRLKNAQKKHRHAEKQTNKLLGVLERAQAFVTQGDSPVTVRPEKIHVDLEKDVVDPDFVHYTISRDNLDGD